jgi:hypothetical protein
VTDVVLIAVIVAFFVAGAGVVRLLDGMITRAGLDADPGDEAELGPGGAELGPGRDSR